MAGQFGAQHQIARAESVQAAKDSTITMLSYKPDSVDQQLNDARDLLTGDSVMSTRR